jgi:hypothetical protein
LSTTSSSRSFASLSSLSYFTRTCNTRFFAFSSLAINTCTKHTNQILYYSFNTCNQHQSATEKIQSNELDLDKQTDRQTSESWKKDLSRSSIWFIVNRVAFFSLSISKRSSHGDRRLMKVLSSTRKYPSSISWSLGTVVCIGLMSIHHQASNPCNNAKGRIPV